MVIPDLINALFEFLGGWFIFLHILTLRKDKCVRGVNFFAAAFFAVWGAWNVFYYPYLDQMFSFFAGIFILIMNTIWVSQLYYYTRKELL